MRFNLYTSALGAANAVQKRIINCWIARDFGDRPRVNSRFELREKAPRRAIGRNDSHIGVEYDQTLAHFIYGRVQQLVSETRFARVCEPVNHSLLRQNSNAETKQKEKPGKANRANRSGQKECREKECCR